MTSLFAHRGHHVRWPENSVAAVAEAVDVGADGVEVDVWLSADKNLVVNHDRTLGARDVTRTSLGELAVTAPVATLGEILDAAGELLVNVEIKSTRSVAYNLAAAAAVARYLDRSSASPRCLVSSFSLAVCDEVRRISPGRRVGWLVTRQRADAVFDRVGASGLTSLHLPFTRVNRRVAQRAIDQGVELHVWTPTLEADLRRMLDLAVGALITDDVALARDLRAGR
ncbi:MAG: glycerophosphodiester phosphodiesterase [Actinomycetota bacterium]|nr:glycerophosphodiester phosphodiesterase [Actinomycetota bacterium]